MLTKNIRIFLMIVTAFFYCNSIFAQEKERSKEIKTINGNKYYMHTVAKGQTLYSISKIYNQGVNDIVIENPDAIDGISPGQVLKILFEKKTEKKETIDSTKYSFHKVEKKETFYSISKKYNLSIDEIKKLNPGIESGLKEGQILKLPLAAKTNYTIKTITSDSTKLKPIIDSSKINYTPSFKNEYNIAIFLPFHADQANLLDPEKLAKNDIQYSSKTKIAIQFYQGAMIAIDSLKKQKLNAKIFIYDVDDSDSSNIHKILSKPEFSSMDMIIGPLYGSSFMPVATFAKQKRIPIISPLTQANKILYNNNYVCKVTPSTSMKVEQIAKYIVDSFANENIILVNNSNPKEVSYFNSYKESINKFLLEKGKSKNDTVKIAKGLGPTLSLINKSKKNIVILTSNNQSYVTDFVSKLNADKERDKTNIILFGMQNWTNFDNLDFEYLNNLSLHIPSNNCIAYDSSSTKYFIDTYRLWYKTFPESYVFNGFDVTYYFISALQKYGTNFPSKLPEIKHKGISTNFDFYKYPSESGYENKETFILKYKDYKLVNAKQ